MVFAKARAVLFSGASWAAMFVLTLTSVPQIILNFQRHSTEGVSWVMFVMLLFGMAVMFLRSLTTKGDLIIRLNFGIGTLLVLLVNIQILYFSF